MYVYVYVYVYTRSPLEDSVFSDPAPGENLLSGNLVMETGCIHKERVGDFREILAKKDETTVQTQAARCMVYVITSIMLYM